MILKISPLAACEVFYVSKARRLVAILVQDLVCVLLFCAFDRERDALLHLLLQFGQEIQRFKWSEAIEVHFAQAF